LCFVFLALLVFIHAVTGSSLLIDGGALVNLQ